MSLVNRGSKLGQGLVYLTSRIQCNSFPFFPAEEKGISSQISSWWMQSVKRSVAGSKGECKHLICCPVYHYISLSDTDMVVFPLSRWFFLLPVPRYTDPRFSKINFLLLFSASILTGYRSISPLGIARQISPEWCLFCSSSSMTVFALILKALIKCVIYVNECANILGTSSSRFLKHFKKYFLTENKIENVLFPELLGL